MRSSSRSGKFEPTRFSKIKNMGVLELSEMLAGKTFTSADDAFAWLVSSPEEETK